MTTTDPPDMTVHESDAPPASDGMIASRLEEAERFRAEAEREAAEAQAAERRMAELVERAKELLVEAKARIEAAEARASAAEQELHDLRAVTPSTVSAQESALPVIGAGTSTAPSVEAERESPLMDRLRALVSPEISPSALPEAEAVERHMRELLDEEASRPHQVLDVLTSRQS